SEERRVGKECRYRWSAYHKKNKTPLGTTPFNLVYGKSCHLPVELEYKALWAIKFLNFDIKSAKEKRLLQLHELEEIRLDAFENSRIYKERTKAFHDKKILKREFIFFFKQKTAYEIFT